MKQHVVRIGGRRSLAMVFGLALASLVASGVPDNHGTDAAIGWWSFVTLTLALVAMAGSAVVRSRRAGSSRGS